jgi:hypothetical protein
MRADKRGVLIIRARNVSDGSTLFTAVNQTEQRTFNISVLSVFSVVK